MRAMRGRWRGGAAGALLVVLSAWATATVLGTSGHAVPPAEEGFGLRIEAALARTTFAVGEPIVARVTVRNVTDRQLTYQARAPELSALDVTGVRGDAVPKTRFARYEDTPPGGALVQAVLEPGEAVTDYQVLNQYADLSVPGAYSFTVTRFVFTTEGDFRRDDFRFLESMPVQFRIEGTDSPSAAVQRLQLSQSSQERIGAIQAVGTHVADALAALQAVAAEGGQGEGAAEAARALERLRALLADAVPASTAD